MLVTYTLSICSVLLFTLCLHMFVRVLTKPVPVINTTPYTRTALKLRRGYSIFAWGLMSGTFLMALTVSFYQVFVEL